MNSVNKNCASIAKGELLMDWKNTSHVSLLQIIDSDANTVFVNPYSIFVGVNLLQTVIKNNSSG